jgi:membrane protein YdbS with pleckstrin-like domain
VALLVSAVAAFGLGWRALFVAGPALVWAVVSARQHVRHLGWAAAGEVVAFRSGWLGRRETRVKVSRIQTVTARQSPLDRRAAMAKVRVDTAGAGERSHRVDIPYLHAELARTLSERLAGQAANTAFRW